MKKLNTFCRFILLIPVFAIISASFSWAATCTWLGGSGDWNDPAKWSCGTVPTAADSAIVAGCAQTITLTADASVAYLKILCGGNTIIGPYTVDVAGLTEFAEFQYTLGGCTINMNGGGTLKGSLILNGATLHIATGQTFDYTGTGANISGTGGILTNNGTIAITQSSNGLSCQLNNNGLVSIATGSSLNISNGNFSLNGGDYLVNGSLTLGGISSNFSVDNASFTGTGLMSCATNATTFGSGCSFVNTLDFSLSATTVGNGFPALTTTTFNGAVSLGNVSVFGAKVKFADTAPSTLENFIMTTFSANGVSVPILESNGDLHVQNLNYTAGTISGSFTLAANGLTLMPVQFFSTKTINGASLELYGNCNWNFGNIVLQNGAVLRNMPGSTFTENLQGNGYSIQGGGTFENQGIFEVTSLNGPGVACNFNNSGTIRGSNTLQLSGAFANTGTWSPGISSLDTLSVNPNLQIGTGSVQIELGSSGNDLLHSDGNISLDGALEVLLENGFTPSTGQTFTILTAGGNISGTFQAATLPINPNFWTISYPSNAVVLAYDPCSNPPLADIAIQDNFPTSGQPGDAATCHSGDLAFGANIAFNTGTPPFDFLWSANPAANVVFTNNTASFTGAQFTNTTSDPLDVEITLTVTDASGCTAQQTALVSVSPLYNLDLIRTENSGTANDGGICFGDLVTFEASILQSGTFTYQWQEQAPPNPPQALPDTGAVLTIAPPYNNQNTIYYATATDGHGCSVAGFSSAKGIEEIIANSFFKPACTPGHPDSIRVEVSGGSTSSGNYLFETSTLPLPEFHGPVWTFPVFVPSGTMVTILAKDEKGCSDEADMTLPAPPPFLEASATANSTGCGNTGSVVMTATGGTEPYAFLWSNNETTGSIQQLPAGTYSGTLTDANGCTAGATADVILVPDVLWYMDADGDSFGDPSVEVLQCPFRFCKQQRRLQRQQPVDFSGSGRTVQQCGRQLQWANG
jgi:hypothetical protein